MVISILTFNVWFSEYYRSERIKEIIRIIMENKPTIICLQEVINETLSIVLENDFIKKNYETSIKELNRVYGELILYSKKAKVNISNIHRFSLTRMERHINHIELELGSKKVKRDWGLANEYMDVILEMLNNEPQDRIIATGTNITLEKFVDLVFDNLNLDSKKYIKLNNKLSRPDDLFYREINQNELSDKIYRNITKSPEEVIKKLIKEWLNYG